MWALPDRAAGHIPVPIAHIVEIRDFLIMDQLIERVLLVLFCFMRTSFSLCPSGSIATNRRADSPKKERPPRQVMPRGDEPQPIIPSDPISQPNSPPACNGTELRSQNRRALSLRLPATSFRRLRINASRRTSQLFWPEPASRSGLSLSRDDCLSPGRHFEVKAPDLLLRCPADRWSSSFGSWFPHALRLAPVRARSTPESRCLTHRPAVLIVPRISTPLRGLSNPSGSKRSI
jgi:hypothetical protein